MKDYLSLTQLATDTEKSNQYGSTYYHEPKVILFKPPALTIFFYKLEGNILIFSQ